MSSRNTDAVVSYLIFTFVCITHLPMSPGEDSSIWCSQITAGRGWPERGCWRLPIHCKHTHTTEHFYTVCRSDVSWQLFSNCGAITFNRQRWGRTAHWGVRGGRHRVVRVIWAYLTSICVRMSLEISRSPCKGRVRPDLTTEIWLVKSTQSQMFVQLDNSSLPTPLNGPV